MPEHRLQRTRDAYDAKDFDRHVTTEGHRLQELVDREASLNALARAIASSSRQLREIYRPMK